MAKFILKLNTANFYTPDKINVRTRNEVHSHEVPRVGELVDVGSFFNESGSLGEPIALKVVAVIHPISDGPFIHVPEVQCDASQLPKGIYEIIREDARWTTSSPIKE